VTNGDWSSEGLLMTCSLDKMLTVSNHQGDTTCESYIVKGEPSNIKWSPLQDENNKVMCCIIGGQKIFRFNPKTQSNTYIEFEKGLGKIT
jgi:hypothetical protein